MKPLRFAACALVAGVTFAAFGGDWQTAVFIGLVGAMVAAMFETMAPPQPMKSLPGPP